MANVSLVPKLQPQIAEMHAITADGRMVLIETHSRNPVRRARAAHNLKRWNEGKRTWLL
jgi:hypothetical protein